VDIEAARRNGLPSIGVLYGCGSEREFEEADVVAASLFQLPGLMRSLLGNLRVI
jgi:phosphoglycolate phosphatase-like HAD superfamily hydrolase